MRRIHGIISHWNRYGICEHLDPSPAMCMHGGSFSRLDLCWIVGGDSITLLSSYII